jgi:hypothetical protein
VRSFLSIDCLSACCTWKSGRKVSLERVTVRRYIRGDVKGDALRASRRQLQPNPTHPYRTTSRNSNPDLCAGRHRVIATPTPYSLALSSTALNALGLALHTPTPHPTLLYTRAQLLHPSDRPSHNRALPETNSRPPRRQHGLAPRPLRLAAPLRVTPRLRTLICRLLLLLLAPRLHIALQALAARRLHGPPVRKAAPLPARPMALCATPPVQGVFHGDYAPRERRRAT